MIIVCDLDGCLADFNTAFAKVLKNINPHVKVDPTDDSFPAVWNWPSHCGYSSEDEARAWQEAKFSGLFWSSLFGYANTKPDLEYLNLLQKQHDIYFATTRPGPTAKQESEWWLVGQGFRNPTVVITDDKPRLCQAIHADVIIDDRPENLLKQWIQMKAVMFKRPYNKGFWGYFDRTVSSIREGLDGWVS